MPVGSGSITYVDYDGQKGIFVFNTSLITAANFAAIDAAIDTLITDTNAITDGQPAQKTMSQTTLLSGVGVKSAVPDSQRGNKWDVKAYDITQNLAAGVPNPYFRKPFDYLVPTADFDMRVDNNNIVFVLGGANNDPLFDAFVASFEAVAKSPVGGSLNVYEIEAVTVAGG